MPVTGVKHVKQTNSGKKQSKKPSSRSSKTRSSSCATASSLESDGIVKATVDSKETVKLKERRTQSSAKKLSGKSKHKSKTKKSKDPNVAEKTLSLSHQVDASLEDENIGAVATKYNETLRWSNACSDSEDEAERLITYKENRRKRYAEAMQVKILQKMTGQI